MIKLVILIGLVAVVLGDVSHLFNRRPQQYSRPPQIPLAPQPGSRSGAKNAAILRYDNEVFPDGSYRYVYDTENGISAQESGQQSGSGETAGTSAQGSYQYTSPEGVPVQIQYIADENGFQPSGNVLPTPPPIPEAIQRSIEFNARNAQPQQPTFQQPYRRF